MRPLLIEFPEDETCWEVDDEFLFGRDLLVAPVLEQGAKQRRIYLPAGAQWTDAWTGEPAPAGTVVVVDVPLQQIPVFFRDEARLPIAK
jgi:alpha-D-xyloside xylohydrolase